MLPTSKNSLTRRAGSRLLLALGSLALAFHASDAKALGATVPFTTYEAEAGTLSGGASVRKLAAPINTAWSSPELEASGRAFVELKTTGDTVTWPNHTGAPVTALDFRYSIPDTPTGGGSDATLNLYVDGAFRQSVPVTSKQTWLYSSNAGDWDGMAQDPTLPNAHIFFEEVHFFITGAPVAPGSAITLQKDAANTAAFYWVDLMDLEAPQPAVAQPANSISITDNGAVATPLAIGPIPDNAVDSTAAIQKTIDAAAAQKKTVWVPPGRFIVTGAGLHATGITIAGAGMWYSTIYRNLKLPYNGNAPPLMEVTSCTLQDFMLDSNSTSRTGADGDSAGVNISGTGWLVQRLWVEHTSSGVWAKGTGGTVKDCRVLSTWGDGVNLNNGNTGNVGNNLTADNNYVRGVGDDGVTINSDVTSQQMDTVTLKNNTTVSIYWADGLRVAGGKNVLVENNLICDPVNFPGIIVGIFNGANLESGIVRGNTVIRAGGDAYNAHKAALQIGADNATGATVSNVQILNNTFLQSMQKAVELVSSTAITLDGNLIDGLWASGAAAASDVNAIDLAANTSGAVTFSKNTLQNLTASQISFVNHAGAAKFQASGTGNSGFDPTVAGPTLWGAGPGAAPLPVTVKSCTASLTDIPVTGGSGGSGGAAQGGASGAGTAQGGASALPQAGAGGSPIGGAGTGSAGQNGNAGSTSSQPPSSADPSGCGCRVARGERGALLSGLLLLGTLSGLSLARRRSRRPRR